MSSSLWMALLLPFAVGMCLAAETVPMAEITNGSVRVRLYLPDAKTGFYRGTRFDWSGVIAGLHYAGHDYYPQWFQRTDPKVHDFTYDGNDIVAGPCTAITGPAEEFVADGQALGFDLAQPGGTFIKIGVGVLRRPDDKKYDPYRLYPIQDGGRWTVNRQPDAIEFKHELADPSTGYAYEYRKTVSLEGDQPRMVLDHALRNTGRRVIRTSVYNHNFLYLDRRAPGPEFSIEFPFEIQASLPAAGSLGEISGNRLSFSRELAGKDVVYLDIKGFGGDSKDHDIRIENRGAGMGVRITGDRPLARAVLWAIRAPLSIEPFVSMNIEPGADFTWRIQYDYYRK